VFSHEQCERTSERVSNCCHVVRIYVWESPQKSEPGKCIAHLCVFEQLELQFVPRILPVRGELAVHHVDGVCTLIGRQTDAAPEEEQKHISMASEHRSEYVSLLLVWSEPVQFFAGAAATMVKQDCGKRAMALGRQRSACRVTDPLCTTTVWGQPDSYPCAVVASADIRMRPAKMVTHGLVICTPTRLIEQSGCTDRAPETTIPGNQPAFADVSAPVGLRAQEVSRSTHVPVILLRREHRMPARYLAHGYPVWAGDRS
jgi:hypothetical protein